MAEGTTLQRAAGGIYVTESGFLSDASVTVGSISVNLGEHYVSPTGSGTLVLKALVPADGAVLQAATFLPLSVNTGTHDQEWSISDGTNILAHVAQTGMGTSITVGTAFSLTTRTFGNGKAIATTDGARLTLTNTAVGTSTRGVEGIFRLVWAL